MSGGGFNGGVPTPRFEAAVRRSTADQHLAIAREILRFRLDAGVSRTALAAAAGVDVSFLRRIEDGGERPSLETYQRLTLALGIDLSVRLFANTGPAIRDRWQAPMLEEVLRVRHPRWEPLGEVAVRHPSRGWIDLVLHERRERVLVAAELQSELRRLEQLVRWQLEKAASLPSWEGFVHLGEAPAITPLLIVRRTRATRQVARDFERQLRVAYPAHPDDAIAAITGTAPWPGAALVWMHVDGGIARFVPGR